MRRTAVAYISSPGADCVHTAWARDEPPSPSDELSPGTNRDPNTADDRPSVHRPSDVTSYNSSLQDESLAGPSRWWAFTRHRPEDSSGQSLTANAARHGVSRDRDRSYSVSWLAASLSRRPQDGDANGHVRGEEPERIGTDFRSEAMSEDRLHLDLPPPPQSPITLAQTRTPGWETPWTPRGPGVTWDVDVGDNEEEDDGEKVSKWQKRKKRIRVYMLTNTYVPLVRSDRTVSQIPWAHILLPAFPNREHRFHDLGTCDRDPHPPKRKPCRHNWRVRILTVCQPG